MRNSISIEKAHNGFVVKLNEWSMDVKEKREIHISSNEAELRVVVMKLMEKLYPDPIYADDFVKKEAK